MSSKMREGLYHKIAIVSIYILSFLLEIVCTNNKISLGIDITTTVYIYLVFMEITSVYENCKKINSDLDTEKLSKIFKRKDDEN